MEPQKLFSFRSSLLKERLQLEELQVVRPDYFDAILAFGKQFVESVEGGLPAVLSALSERGSIPLVQWHCVRAFNAAIRNRDLQLVQWFVENGLDLSAEAFKGLLPRLCAGDWPDITEFGELLDSLLEGGVDINDTDDDSYSTALHVACTRGDLPMVRMLVSREADINAVNRMKLVPAHVARESGTPGSAAVEEFLLSLGAEARSLLNKMELRKRPANFRELSVKTTSFHPFNSLWTEIRIKGTHPPRRSYHTGVIHSNKLVVFGGQDLREGIVGGLWALTLSESDPEAEKWEEVPLRGDAPPPVCRHSCVQYEDRLYLFGGTDNVREHRTLFVLDLTDWQWTAHTAPKASCPPEIDSHTASLYLDEGVPWMIVFGGFIAGSRSDRLFAANLNTLEWRQAKPCTATQPCARSNHSAVVHGHDLIIFGGIGDEVSRLGDIWKCDLRMYAWQELRPTGQVPSGRSGHSAVLFAGVMVVFGGVETHNRETNDMFSFDLANNSWAQIQLATQVMDPVSAFQLDDRQQSSKSSVHPAKSPAKVEATSPTRGMQTIAGKKHSVYCGPATVTFGRIAGNIPHPRDGHSAAVYSSKMIVFGGDRSQMPFNDVFCYSLDAATVRTPLTTL